MSQMFPTVASKVTDRSQHNAKETRHDKERHCRRFFEEVFNQGKLEVVDQIFAPETSVIRRPA